MTVTFTFRGVQRSNALVDTASRKINKELQRLGVRIHNVEVRVGDVNGPRGGEDKYCRINVFGPALGAVSVYRSGADPYGAMQEAVSRLGRALRTRLDRRRKPTNRRPILRRVPLAV